MKTPFNVLRHVNQREMAPRDPVTVGGYILAGISGAGFNAVGAAVATAVFGSAITTIVGYLATTAITSWALSALAPDVGGIGGSRGMMVNATDPAAPHDIVYGTVRKGGIRTYVESTGDENKFLHMILVLAGHELAGIDDIYLNDEIVTLDAGGFVTSGDWSSKVRIKKHLGNETVVDSLLVQESNQIDANFVGNGIAYLYVRLEYDQDVFANGIPLITAKVRGRKVYDPRTSGTTYSANASLVVRDYITAGFGLYDSAVDDLAFTASANVSDESIALEGGGTEPRYEVNGVVSSDMSPREIVSRMMSACGGTLFWGQGKWQLHVGYYSNPVKTFTLDDLRGPISLDTRVSARDNFNRVVGTFADIEVDYITSDFPSIESSVFLTEDNGVENTLDMQLPMTTSGSAAQRLAKMTLFRAREQMTLSADFGLEAFGVQVGDIIAFTNERYGWTAKEFEVVGWRFEASGEGGDLRINLTLRETSEAAFAWNAEERQIIHNNTALPDFTNVATLTNLALTATTTINDDGISIPAIRATWDVSTNSFVEYYEIQYKRLGGEEDYGSVAVAQDAQEDWGSITISAAEFEDYGLTNEPILSPDDAYTSIIGTSNSYTITPVLNGYDYQIRVRAINSLGVRSPWVASSIASQGDTTPPNEPLNVLATPAYKSVVIEWANPADQDLSHIEVYVNTTNNLSTATLAGTSASTNFTHYGLANNVTRFYWVRAVDYSLNKSDFSASVTATTLLIAPNDFDDAVNALFTEAGAFGIEPVSELPLSGNFDGQLVLLLPEITIYRWDLATLAWTTEIYASSSVESGTITYASFAAGIEPVGVVDALPTVAGYTGPVVVVLTTDGKLYRLVDGAWTAAINTDDINGQLGENLFSDDLRPIERVSALPTTGLTQGRIVMLTTDNKLYRYTGLAWTAAVPATDVTGQINGAQIADAAVTATKIGNSAVTTAKIANDAVDATKIGAAAVTTAKLANDAVTASKIGSAAVTTAKLATDAVTGDIIAAGAVTETSIASGAISTPKLQAGAVTATTISASAITADKLAVNAVTADSIEAGAITATKIAADAVTADKLAVNAVTAGSIAAGAITATKIAADAVTADKLAVNAVTAGSIAAGAITTAKIAAGAITSGTIAADAITADKLAANSVTADAIAANSVTASEIAAGAVTATQISAGAISADKIAANAVTATAIAADAVIAGKIAANAVDADAIAANSVVAGKIAAGAVNADQIAANAITAGKIFANAVTADKIATDAITANKIAASSIISSKIATGAITAAKISAGAITADAINADAITGKNVTVGNLTNTTVPTGAGTGARIQSDGTMFVGNREEYLRWDGSLLTVNGEIRNIDERIFRGRQGYWERVTSTGSVTAAMDRLGGAGLFAFIMCGGGGSGARGNITTQSQTGGGAGGFASVAYEWNGSEAVSFAAGSGGASHAGSTEVNGFDGSSSVLTIGGVTAITCTGGRKGLTHASGGAGGAGGTGTINNSSFFTNTRTSTGGAGGFTSDDYRQATGGGGINVFQNNGSNDGGNITNTGTGAAQATAGGGPFGSPADNSNAAKPYTGYLDADGFLSLAPSSSLFVTLRNSTPFTPSNGAYSGTGGATSADSGEFSGSGAAVAGRTDDIGASGNAGYGGGSGAAHSDAGKNAFVGSGGNGVLYIGRV